jgi:hypothetical protein
MTMTAHVGYREVAPDETCSIGQNMDSTAASFCGHLEGQDNESEVSSTVGAKEYRDGLSGTTIEYSDNNKCGWNSGF